MADETLPLPLELCPRNRLATKRCARCRNRKPITEFHDRTDQPGKKKSYCKKCIAADQKRRRHERPEKDAAYRRDNPEKIRTWRRNTYLNQRKDFRRCIGMALQVRKRQCHNKGIVFTITADDVVNLFERQQGLCALTGRKLIWGEEGRPRDGLSIDRIEGPLGYMPENIRLVTDQANLARNKFSDDELYSFCEAVLATRAAREYGGA